MSISYTLPDGSEVTLLVANTDGMVDAICRAATKDVWDAAALTAGLTYAVTETVTDPDTGAQTEVPTGEIKAARGVYIDHIGPVVIIPAVLDADGAEITPAVMDTRHHVNFRMAEPALSVAGQSGLPKWVETAIAWSMQGTLDTEVNKNEIGLTLQDVVLIDPATIATPKRIWL